MKLASRIATGVAATTISALALSGCAANNESPDASPAVSEPVKVSVAVLAPGALLWLHAIAEDQGFYADRGVEIEAIQVQSSSALVQAVASGSANAGIALGDNVIKAVDEGADIAITGALFHRSSLRLFGASGVTAIAQLEGAQVTAGAVEGGTADLMFHLLEEGGVDWESVVPVAIPNSSDRIVAMQNGQVAGALLIPPFDSVALTEGATLLATYPDYYIQTPAIVNNAWAAENPEGAAGFTQGLQDAAKWIYEAGNEADAVRILAEYAGVEESAAQDAYDFMVGTDIISPDLSVPVEGIENIVRISSEVHGTDIGDFDASKYIDAQYLN